MLNKLKAVSAIVIAAYASPSLALGVGSIEMKSHVNQPLDASIVLYGTEGMSVSQLIARMGSMQDFERAGVIREYFLDDIRFSVELDNQGGGVIHLRTDNPVVEPYLNFVLDVRWPDGRILREYTALIDFMPLDMAGPVDEAATATAVSELVEKGDTLETSYRVKRGDTLWDIALSVRPDRRYSPQQAMRAIVESNPRAFRGGNINDLQAGAVLTLPGEAQIATVDKDDARRWVQKQNSNWINDAAAVPVPTPKVDEPLEVAEEVVSSSPGDGAYLRLARADEGGSSTQHVDVESLSATGDSERLAGDDDLPKDAVDQQMAVTLENLDLAQRQNEELNNRLEALEQQVETMQQLMALKDQQLAQMQNAAQSADTGLTKTALLGGLGAILLSALGWLLWSRRRGQQHSVVDMPAPVLAMPERPDEREEDSENNEQLDLDVAQSGQDIVAAEAVDSAEDTVVKAEIQPAEAVASKEAPEEPMAQEQIAEATQDPIEEVLNEVDIYLAYSRRAKALELMNALYEEYPEDTRVQLKLLEAAADSDMGRNFQALLAELKASSNVDVQARLAALFAEYPRLLNPVEVESVIDEGGEDALASQVDELEHLDWDIGTTDAKELDEAAEHDVVDEVVSAEPGADESGNEDIHSIDFDLDALEADLESGALEEELVDLDLEDSENSLDDFEDFDLDSLDELAKDMTPLDDEALDLSELSLEDGEEVSLDDMMAQNFANDDAELLPEGEATLDSKLDMAKTCIEMGDYAQARELLDDVERLGSEKQKNEAATLKGSLS